MPQADLCGTALLPRTLTEGWGSVVQILGPFGAHEHLFKNYHTKSTIGICALTEKLPPACQPLHRGRWVYRWKVKCEPHRGYLPSYLQLSYFIQY